MKQERIDILCLCTWREMGGVQNAAARLTRGFIERGYTAKLGFLFDHDPKFKPSIDDYFVVSSSPPEGIGEWTRFTWKCMREIGGLRPRATLAFHPLSAVIGATMTGWQGRFVSRQAWPSDTQRSSTRKLSGLLMHTPLVSANIAVSNFIANSFSAWGPVYRKKTRVIYNEPPRMVEVDDDVAACRARFGMNAGEPVLGALGRLHEQKNVQLAIRAMIHAPRAHLYLAGSGEQEEMLKTLAVDSGVADRVHFLGPIFDRADVTRFFRAVDALLMPSLYEGHPFVMLEAMSVGTAVLAHDVEVMREAGGDAAIYASSDPVDWARQIATMDDAVLTDLRRRSRERSAIFAAESMVERYLEVIGLPPYKQVTH